LSISKLQARMVIGHKRLRTCPRENKSYSTGKEVISGRIGKLQLLTQLFYLIIPHTKSAT
jgi:hypothetical protein